MKYAGGSRNADVIDLVWHLEKKVNNELFDVIVNSDKERSLPQLKDFLTRRNWRYRVRAEEKSRHRV